MPRRFEIGDIVTPNNSYDPANMRVHQVGSISRYKEFTLCGYEVTDTWTSATPWDFDNLEVCQRCDRILMNRASDESIARSREASMGPGSEPPQEKQRTYDSVRHVENALKQKDRLIDRKEEEIVRLRGEMSIERSHRLQVQEQLDDEKTLHQATQRDKEVLMRQVEGGTAILQRERNESHNLRNLWERAKRDIKSLGDTVERFAVEKTKAEARVAELEQHLVYPPMAALTMLEGEEYELHPVRRFLRNGETGEAVAPELYFDIKKDLRKVSPPDAGGFFRVRIIGDVPGRPTERRQEQRRVSVDRRRDA